MNRELFEIENELGLMEVAINGLFTQQKMIDNVSDEGQATIVLPVLCNNMGFGVPSGEAFETVKKIAVGIGNGIKAIIKKIIELGHRFITWVVSFFSKEQAAKMTIQREMGKLEKKLSQDFKTLGLKANMDMAAAEKAMNEKIKKEVDPEGKLDNFEVLIAVNGNIVDPSKTQDTPLEELVDINKVIPINSKKKPDKEKGEIRQPRAHADYQNLYFDPSSSDPFGENNAKKVHDITTAISSYYADIDGVFDKYLGDVDGTEINLLAKLIQEKLEKLNTKLLKDCYSPAVKDGVAKLELPGLNEYTLNFVSNKVLKSDLSWYELRKTDRSELLEKHEGKRPVLATPEITANDLKENIEGLGDFTKDLEKDISDSEKVLKTAEKTLDNQVSYEDLPDKEKGSVSKEDHTAVQKIIELHVKNSVNLHRTIITLTTFEKANYQAMVGLYKSMLSLLESNVVKLKK